MSFELLRDVSERRSTAATELQSLYATADERPEGERNLTAEEETNETRISEEMRQLENRQANIIRDMESAAAAQEAEERFGHGVGEGDPTVSQYQTEMRNLVDHVRSRSTDEFLIQPPSYQDAEFEELRSTGIDTFTAGAASEVVPTDTLFGQIWGLIEDRSSILSAGARTFNTSTGTPMTFTKKTGRSGSAWVGEGQQIPQSLPGTDKMTLTSKKNGVIIPFTNEFGRDAVFNAGSWVVEDGSEELAIGIEEGLMIGSGTGTEPGGVALAPAGATLDTADDAGLTYEKFIDLIHSIPNRSRRGSAIRVNDSSIAAWRKLKDGDDRPLWQPSLIPGQPDTLLGYALEQDPHLAKTTDAGSVIGVFGDMRGFLVRRVGAISIRRDESYLFDTDEVAYRFTVSIDSGVLDERIIKTLRTP